MANRKPPKNAFKKGQSGNPSGRPKGSASYVTAIMRVCSVEDWEEIVRGVVEQAKAKKPWAVEWLGQHLATSEMSLKALHGDEAQASGSDLLLRLKEFLKPNGS